MTIPDIHKKRFELRARKNHDYAKDGDPYWNFRLVTEMAGIPAWIGAYIRLLDKVSRIGNFIEKGVYKVEDEKLEDTLMDLCNYADITYELYMESIKQVVVPEEVKITWVYGKGCGGG